MTDLESGVKYMLQKHLQGEYRRTKADRRTWAPMPQTPFTDSDGKWVVEDRRCTADRRIQNIDVVELTDVEFVESRAIESEWTTVA